MFSKLAALCVLTFSVGLGFAEEYFAAPYGTPAGSGREGAPWDLQTALDHPAGLLPGDTIWMLPGRYGDASGLAAYVSHLTGTPARPILLRRRGPGRATINGTLTIYGGNTWYWGFEVTNSITDRTAAPDGNSALPTGINCYAPGTRLINLVVHDTAEGLGLWVEAPDTEAYGNIIYYNGYQGTDRGHGHGMYVQNHNGIKILAENIVFDQFGVGIHCYNEQSWDQSIIETGNIVFNNGSLSDGGQLDANILFASQTSPLRDIVVEDNFTYDPPSASAGFSQVGWQFDNRYDNAVVRGNYWIGGNFAIMVDRWKHLTFEDNTIFTTTQTALYFDYPTEGGTGHYHFGGNRYYGAGGFHYMDAQLSWAAWLRATGFDQTSEYHGVSPSGVWTFIRPNRYERNRANIVVYNWDLAPSVSLDLSRFLDLGSAYEIRDVQDFWGPPVLSDIYQGGSVQLPIQARSPSVPNGRVPTPPQHTAPQFAVYVLLPRDQTMD